MEDEEDTWDPPPATLLAPQIPGLYFDPELTIDDSYADDLVKHVLPYFQGGSNQVMLFGKTHTSDMKDTPGGLPLFISELIPRLSELLGGHIPASTHTLLFPRPSESIYHARQIIFNLYRPGEGITPHIDLLGRYGDGIIAISLLSGTVMTFTPAESSSPSLLAASDPDSQLLRHQLWLPPRSVIVMEKEARYNWMHGIPARKQDFIEGDDLLGNHWRDRYTRISITIRWLLPGAEIVGGDGPMPLSS